MGIGIWELVLLLLIVLVLFGTKKLKTIGGDLGSAIKGFRKAISEEEAPPAGTLPPEKAGEAADKDKETD